MFALSDAALAAAGGNDSSAFAGAAGMPFAGAGGGAVWMRELQLYPESLHQQEQQEQPVHNPYADQVRMAQAGPPQWDAGPPHLRAMPTPSAPPMQGAHDRQYDIPARSPSPMDFHVMPPHYHDQAVNAPVPAV